MTTSETIPVRTGMRATAALLGPAFVAAVAYVDPGNFATNIAAGARHGYLLVWVIVAANLMAMLVQYLSAKLGIATGMDLPELCRARFRKGICIGLWIQAELVAMATDLAEFVGAALGLNLLLHVPLFPAGVITAAVAFVVLALEQRGYRRFQLAIVALLALVSLGFGYDLVVSGASAGQAAHGLLPRFDGSDSVLLSAGIIGATVMPHVIYLHSALTKRLTRQATRQLAGADTHTDPTTDSAHTGTDSARTDAGGATGDAHHDIERSRLLRATRWDVVVGLGLAGIINLAMLLVAAALFHTSGHAEVDTIAGAHAALGQVVGGTAALAFAVALLASGLSSSSVGTYAGQIVMQGFIARRIPLQLRRGLTMVPALVVLGFGLPTTGSLVISQVVLSFGIPFALVPLVMLTRRADVMGSLRNRAVTTAAASTIAAVIIALNLFLVAVTISGG